MDASSAQNLSFNILKLIQPDLLSVEELESILFERGVGQNLLSQSKEKLVALFKNVALPLPQREFRPNYRGSLLMKMRQKAERKKIVVNSVDKHKSYTVGVNDAARSSKQSCGDYQKCDRLKPPPELVSSEKKKIRLNTSSQSSEGKSNSSSDLDKIVIKKLIPSERNNDVEKKHCENNDKSDTDRLSANSHEDKSNDACHNGSKNIVPRKISLKRNHLTSTSSVSSVECTTDKSPSEPDKKRKPITWP